MDAAPPPLPEEPPARDWSLLPLDVLSSVFVMLGAVDVLMGAGLVCRSWLQAAKFPDVWRVVDITNDDIVVGHPDPDEYHFWNHDVLQAMAKAAVDRAGGQLQVFAGKEFVTDELVQYILERSPSMTTLRLVSCCDYGVSERLAAVIRESPLSELRSLELDNVDITVDELTAVLENCPVLEVLRLSGFSERLAAVIRESPLSELRSLELDNVDITVDELTAVLENCPVLEVLRLSHCFGMHNEDEHALRAEFPWIKSLTLEERDDYSDDYFEINGSDIPYYAYFD